MSGKVGELDQEWTGEWPSCWYQAGVFSQSYCTQYWLQA